MISGGYNGDNVCERGKQSLAECTKDMNAIWSRLFTNEFDRHYLEFFENAAYGLVCFSLAFVVAATSYIYKLGPALELIIPGVIGLIGAFHLAHISQVISAEWNDWEAFLSTKYHEEFNNLFKKCQKAAITFNRLCQKYPS